MSHRSGSEIVTSDEKFSLRVGFDSREQALLDAWDQHNVPSHLGEAFEKHLVAAYEAAIPFSLRSLEAGDDATCALMAATASLEVEAHRDADEFSEIAEQHEAHLQRVALRLCGDKETTRDLVQETLARAWSRFGHFEPGSNARAWLVTILMRLFYDHIKHARVISKAEPDLRTLEPADCDMAPLQVSDAQLWEAVHALEPDLRCVVERCYIRGMSYKAIAEDLQLPIGTIGTRLRRARERLKLLLDAGDRTAP